MSILYDEETKRLRRVLDNWLTGLQRTEGVYNVLVELYNDVVCYEMDMYGTLSELTIDSFRNHFIKLEKRLFNKHNIDSRGMVAELFPTMLSVEFYLKVLDESLKKIIDTW